MREERPLQVIWRRKWVVLITFLVFAVGTAVISKSLPKVYATTSTLLVAQPEATGFDSVQASQFVARSYADIIASPNFAERVAGEFGRGSTREALQDATAFETVPETQLLRITAEDASPGRAKEIADAYAASFIQYSNVSLAKTTRAQVSLADAAPLPNSPARPKPTLYTVVASILGLAIGLGLASLSSLLDRRVSSPEELAELLDVPLLASILLARSDRTRRLNEEAYRVLRTNLEFVRPDKPLNSVAVVSPSESEGKTSTVLNLGRAVAEIGDRVILVEGDMRRPALQTALLPETTEPLRPGLSNYLSGAADLDEVIHPTDNPRIRIVPAGPIPPTASTLLDTERGQRLLRKLGSEADLVVVDSPPLSVGADASLLSVGADECLMVIDTRRSTVKAIRAAIQQLKLVNASLAGVILNRVKQSADDAPYGYYAPEVAKRGRFGRRRGRRAESGPTRAAPAIEDDLPREILTAESVGFGDEGGSERDTAPAASEVRRTHDSRDRAE